ncbi:EAL and modified HD-GYP domain-containing signal transduction protein [Silvibacterium bohemicum]|uniref:EAL and modified HD-GYP domain-containing signal transduction protein n=1 Tax=Silvibacterium bohemicum TaxID=1577686 RepID=A0A841JMS8_9BACT|nr:HDOD domain-containing protein [Silvibacterium bohemicum]MBB6142543.1 EAL and modified HD-GYP domain-containing signal transduction protein [Silvibacterium bohemicum]
MKAAEQVSFDMEGQSSRGRAQPTRFVARQPIFDARRNVYGYELLFRSGWENSFSGDIEDATRQMLDNCLVWGVDSLAGGGLAFVNCTREALVSQLVTQLPPGNTVLEILETVEPDEELLKACRALRAMGYVFALDDFVPRPEMRPLVEMARFVKVDFRLSDAAERRRIHAMVCGSPAALLAEKIETPEEFSAALAEGYEYFQGYFFCRPKIFANREIPSSWANYLRLLAELTESPFDARAVIRIIMAETSICYRLLRLANSALLGTRKEVTSVQSALILVGEDRFRRLVSLAVSSALGRDQPPALISLSLERARFCELVAPLLGQNPHEQYMLGLLSLLDAILQCPMEKLLKSLPLRPEAKAALLGAENSIALPLNLIRCYEAGAWEPCAGTIQSLGLSEERLAGIYMEAIRWTTEAIASTR